MTGSEPLRREGTTSRHSITAELVTMSSYQWSSDDSHRSVRCEHDLFMTPGTFAIDFQQIVVLRDSVRVSTLRAWQCLGDQFSCRDLKNRREVQRSFLGRVAKVILGSLQQY
jgi:hypothetical protein